jgi:hypothetical protein
MSNGTGYAAHPLHTCIMRGHVRSSAK